LGLAFFGSEDYWTSFSTAFDSLELPSSSPPPPPPPSPGSISIVVPAGGYSILENVTPLTVTVRRSGGTDGAVAVNYHTTSGTANRFLGFEVQTDFVPASGTLTWANGDSADKTFIVQIIDFDFLFFSEPNETFNVVLSNPTNGATLGTPSTTVVTIIED
jgi:hypothetical protein